MKITALSSNESVTLIVDGKAHSLRKGQPNFITVKKLVRDGQYEDAAKAMSLFGAIEVTTNGKLTVVDGKPFYNGAPLHDVFSQKFNSILALGKINMGPLVAYVEKVLQNPDPKAVYELFDFLYVRELAITEDGDVLGYKGLENDFWSKKGNPKTIVLKGKVDEQGRIFNGVGEEIEVARISVDSDRSVECSTGLHVGSYAYAKGFSNGKLVLVRFNPRDAVSVPKGEGFQKLRCCHYTVVADVTGQPPIEKPIYDLDEKSGPLTINQIVEKIKSIAAAQGLDPTDSFDVEEIRSGFFDDALQFEEADWCEALAVLGVSVKPVKKVVKGAVKKVKKPVKVSKASPALERLTAYIARRVEDKGLEFPTLKQMQSSLKGSEFEGMTQAEIKNLLNL